ncbi:DNA repair protein rhp41 [Colletotrichum chlorophyti]|uniref:DNA repair protein rhp41 n=1 Tax=Colletotrichum chlorophyti TaxID=708187 RepID=A0A1Q8S3J5_9PEZI|nr:DNA repair protein rhp41 [Colletotrichum chlorophyti]
MAGRKRTRASRLRATESDLPDVYQELLAEAAAGAGPSVTSEPPTKKLKRPGERKPRESTSTHPDPGPPPQAHTGEDDDDEDIEFEDVTLPAATVQTMYRESDEEEEGEDQDEDEDEIVFENVDFGAVQLDSGTPQEPQKLTLNLSEHAGPTVNSRKALNKRRPITKEEKERRISIHRTHLLCLVLHCALRNRWCDDDEVQRSLRPLLSKKTVNYLTPSRSLPQFGQTESLKNGLQQAGALFTSKFQITERGLRRSLWAEDPDHLAKYEPPSNMDSCMDRSDFREAARKLCGSRDVGAQLYCALLRSAGVRARLVCSLQPLSFTSNGPTLPKPRDTKVSAKAAKAEKIQAQLAQHKASLEAPSSSASSVSSPLRRLGHPNAAAYQLPPIPKPPSARQPQGTPKRIRESPYPVYWVEVLDVGHQKWQPVDPLVTNSMWKPRALEPPATDKENSMTYVVAFDSDGTVRDVTRRYAKAYTAKTRRLRIETAVQGGDRWWRKALKVFARRWPTDLDQIEDNELNAIEGREPMPRNVADFKDHPVFALERHLRRNEVLVPDAQPAGTVSAGNKAPLEKVYRRKDVRIARSRDKWYRLMGREVKPMEVPVKFLPRRSNAKPGEYVDDGYGGDERDAAGTPVFTQEQTELYRAPPIVNGQVPKNKFGNIDVYVPTMVPEGGVHIPDEFDTAARAAYTLGIDYAPALSGFQFKGRHGTAVFNGVVVAKEYEEAVRAVMDGFEGMDAQAEQSQRSLVAIRMWRRFLTALRIHERVWAGADPQERAEEEKRLIEAAGVHTKVDENDYDVDEGGGFFAEDAGESSRYIAEDDRSKGGFIAEDEVAGGGFMSEDGDGGAQVVMEGGDGTAGGDPGQDNLVSATDAVAEADGQSEGEGGLEHEDSGLEDALSDVTEEYDMEEDEDGGGFLLD